MIHLSDATHIAQPDTLQPRLYTFLLNNLNTDNNPTPYYIPALTIKPDQPYTNMPLTKHTKFLPPPLLPVKYFPAAPYCAAALLRCLFKLPTGAQLLCCKSKQYLEAHCAMFVHQLPIAVWTL